MTSLIIETSTERGLVAFLDEGRLLFQKSFPFGYNSSAHLLPTVQEGLSQIGLNARSLSKIICGKGPGSYTGIRMGAICAKTLAYSLEIPIIGICSLQAFVPNEEGTFSVLIDAKIGGVYLQSAFFENGRASSWTEPLLCAYSDMPQSLLDSKFIISPNYEAIRPKMLEKYPINAQWLSGEPSWQAIYEASLGNENNEGDFQILYLRKTQAEIEKENQKKV